MFDQSQYNFLNQMGKVAEATEVIQLQKINWEPESNNNLRKI